MQQVETLLGYFGFRLARITGSHHIFVYKDDEQVIVINVPLHGNKVKPTYIKQMLDKIKPLIAEDEPEDEDDDQ